MFWGLRDAVDLVIVAALWKCEQFGFKIGQILNDKNSLTADPNNADFAYAVWDRFRDLTIPPGSVSKDAVKVEPSADGVVAVRERAKQLTELAKRGRQPTELFFNGPAVIDAARTLAPRPNANENS